MLRGVGVTPLPPPSSETPARDGDVGIPFVFVVHDHRDPSPGLTGDGGRPPVAPHPIPGHAPGGEGRPPRSVAVEVTVGVGRVVGPAAEDDHRLVAAMRDLLVAPLVLIASILNCPSLFRDFGEVGRRRRGW